MQAKSAKRDTPVLTTHLASLLDTRSRKRRIKTARALRGSY